MSLLTFKSPAEVAAEIRMSRTAFPGCFLVVEGTDDSRFFRSRICEGDCEIVIAEGKLNVLGALEQLRAGPRRDVAAVVDDDCDSLALQGALDDSVWQTTRLFQDLRSWENMSPPFRILNT